MPPTKGPTKTPEFNCNKTSKVIAHSTLNGYSKRCIILLGTTRETLANTETVEELEWRRNRILNNAGMLQEYYPVSSIDTLYNIETLYFIS